MGSGVSDLYDVGATPLVEEEHLNEMKKKGVKFTPEDVVLTAKDRNGNLVWLENGDNNKGLQHILYGTEGKSGHAKDFKNAFDVSQ